MKAKTVAVVERERERESYVLENKTGLVFVPKFKVYYVNYRTFQIVLKRSFSIRLKNNYNFGVVKLHLKFNQRTKSTPHKFQTRFPSQNLILFQPFLNVRKKTNLNLRI